MTAPSTSRAPHQVGRRPKGRIDIAALKRRRPLAEVVEASGVKLRGQGRVRQGPCPFHEEERGSFTVYQDSQRWHCFGCGLGGDALDFIQRLEGVDLPEAIRRLDGGGWSTPPRSGRESEHVQRPLPAVRDPTLLTAAQRFYATQLERSPEALSYLNSRGINREAARRLGLGYAPGHGVARHLRRLGFSQERIEQSGLVTERGERFRGMIVVPDLIGGRVHWLVGRAISPDARLRFQALPGPKPALGLGRLPRPAPWVALTEGVFDWLLLASWGLPACAALGTQGLDRVASALQGQPRVFVAFDSDEAGQSAAEQLTELLGDHRSAIVQLPRGIGDVAELGAHPNGRGVFLEQLRQAAAAARHRRHLA